MVDFARDEDRDRLIKRARSGDEAALEELLTLYRPYLRLLARLKMHSQLRAKIDDSDLVQETVTAAYRDFPQFRGDTESQLAAWLREILAHTSQNIRQHYFRQRRDVRLEKRLVRDLEESSFMIGNAMIAPGTSASEKEMRRERAVQLAEILSQLPGDYREVLILRDLEGRKLSEVAVIMGRSVDSVQKLWTRALSQLRRLIEGQS